MTTDDYLLLSDKRRCPGCGHAGHHPRNGMCSHCGLRLFPHTDYRFEQFEKETGIVLWWAFDKNRGWMHRDHFMVTWSKPQTRVMKVNLPERYGTHTTPEAVAQRGGKLTKAERSKLA